MTDPLRTYCDLYHQAVECRRRIDALKSVLQRAVEALDKRPEHFRFDGIDAVGIPEPRSRAFLASEEWPTAPQIQHALAEWHATGQRLNEAWYALWPRDRELLSKTPPESAGTPRAPSYAAR